MKATIFLIGLSFDKPEKLKVIECDNDIELAGILKELQTGYCEGEKVKLRYEKVAIKEKQYQTIESYSHSDYSHKAFFRI